MKLLYSILALLIGVVAALAQTFGSRQDLPFLANPGSSAGALTQTLTIGATTNNLLAFPVYVRLADMGATWWSGGPSKANIRVYFQATNSLPLHVVTLDTGNKVGTLFFQANLSNGIPTVVTIQITTNTAAALHNDADGSDNVWSNYVRVYVLDSSCQSGTDRTNPGANCYTNANNPIPVLTNECDLGFDLANGGGAEMTATNISFSANTFTLAGTGYPPTVDGATHSLLSWTDGSGNRVTIGFPSASRNIGVWDPTHSWLFSTSPWVGQTRYRIHGVYSAGTRNIYVNAGSNATDSPGSTTWSGAKMYLGFSDSAEAFAGSIGFCYLCKSALSAYWIFEEVQNLHSPGTFYTISP